LEKPKPIHPLSAIACVVIATVVINVVAVSLLTFAPWSDWRTGAALNLIDNCLLIGFTLSRRDGLLGRFLLSDWLSGSLSFRQMRGWSITRALSITRLAAGR
jgi:hypothetical protein